MYKQLPTQATLEDHFADLVESVESLVTVVAMRHEKHPAAFAACAADLDARREQVQDEHINLWIILKYYEMYVDEESPERYYEAADIYLQHVQSLLNDLEECTNAKAAKQKES